MKRSDQSRKEEPSKRHRGGESSSGRGYYREGEDERRGREEHEGRGWRDNESSRRRSEFEDRERGDYEDGGRGYSVGGRRDSASGRGDEPRGRRNYEESGYYDIPGRGPEARGRGSYEESAYYDVQGRGDGGGGRGYYYDQGRGYEAQGRGYSEDEASGYYEVQRRGERAAGIGAHEGEGRGYTVGGRRASATGRESDAPRRRDSAMGRIDEAPRRRDSAMGREDEAPRRRDSAMERGDEVPRRRDSSMGRGDEAPRRRDSAMGREDEVPRRRDSAMERGDEVPRRRTSTTSRRDEARERGYYEDEASGYYEVKREVPDPDDGAEVGDREEGGYTSVGGRRGSATGRVNEAGESGNYEGEESGYHEVQGREDDDGGGREESRGRGGGGRGRGRGQGRDREAGRGARRGRREEEFDMVISRPVDPQGMVMKKQAMLGNARPISIESNFFRVECRPDWCIFHYRVDFMPDEPDTRFKKKLVRAHGASLGAYVFDGSSLYVSNRLRPDPMVLYGMRETDQEKVEITVRLVGQLAHTDIMYLQLLNIIVRKCMEMMNLEEMGRHFYDRHQAIRIDAHHLELWPGYKTNMRNHEHEILFNVEITHKVLRLDSCLHMLNNLRSYCKDEKDITEQLVGSIVMTIYNRKTYRVDDIEWQTTPASSFDMKGRKVTFIDYFRDKYNLTIRDSRQPMLVSRPKKKDFHRGMTGPILLVPELCQMTGMTDEMRANNNLMKAVAQHLHTDPMRRVAKLKDFIRQLKSIPAIQEELQRWGLKFESRLIEFEGHTIPKEYILFGDHKSELPNEKYDWGQAFRDKPLLLTIPLRSWVVIVPSREAHAVDRLVNTMQRVSTPLRFFISNPMNVRRLGDIRPHEYSKAIDTVMSEYQNRIQMLFVILPKQVSDIYSAVKKRACMEFGIPSQCFVAKNAHNERGMLSICTKLVVQMSAKLGGEPWSVSIPLKKLMIVGFDVYHCGKRKGNSVGAMVASTSVTHAKYFSTVSFHTARDDLSENMGTDFRKCIMAYQKTNNELPERIIMYRDGVGEGQLQYVYETELRTIQAALEALYTPLGRPVPKFTFIVVTKRINTRMFAIDGNRHMNPPPGTVADDVITLPERYDFYLISQFARQGTVSPVSYNVLFDRQGLDADKMQRLTFKLCHMYFNWSGTVTVPAPCQYAHKLAYLTGTALGGRSHEALSNLLYYL